MKNFKLKKLLILMTVALITAAAISPIKASAAWKQSDTGNWSYDEGNSSVSGWKSIDGNWYFFDSNAVMKTGWILDGSTWYYTAPSGEMKTGWVNDGGKWYYTMPSGAMQTGWLSNNGAWYYLSTSGDMKTGLVETNGKNYYLDQSGAMKTGNITVNGTSYTFASNGEKINSTNTNQTTVKPAATATSSSGGSGGSSSSSTNTTKSDSSYKNLYGNWSVSNYTGPKSNDVMVKLAIGQKFTVTKDSMISDLGSVSNPQITESTMSSSDFKKTYNVDSPSNTVNCIKIYDSVRKKTVNVIVSDNGTYIAAKDGLFELKKQ